MSEIGFREHFYGTERDGAGRETGLALLKVNGTGNGTEEDRNVIRIWFVFIIQCYEHPM